MKAIIGSVNGFCQVENNRISIEKNNGTIHNKSPRCVLYSSYFLTQASCLVTQIGIVFVGVLPAG